MKRPLMIELFCGTFGWSHGWLEMGGRSIGFDLAHLPHHGPVPAGADLVIQDVLTLHGSQFRDAAVICASPPCDEFSRWKMPWTRARKPPEPSLELVEASFRIAKEARVPIILENVQAAERWIGPAIAHYGSRYLWGDVPALMVQAPSRKKKHRGRDLPEMKPGFRRCEFCGYEFPDECGRYGCPNCEGDRPKESMSSSWRAKRSRIPEVLARHVARVFWPQI